MAIVTTDDSHYKAIADVIRDRLDDEELTFTPEEMAGSISTACEVSFVAGAEAGLAEGYDGGFAEGYSTGHAEGFEEGKAEGFEDGFDNGFAVGKADGIEEGIQTEYDRFWDAYQQNGTRSDYRYAFAGFGWTTDTFRPKYPIVSTGATGQMFNSIQIRDLKSHMDTFGITIDTSKSHNIEQVFLNSIVETYGVLDGSGASNLNYVLYNAKTLRSITKVKIKNDGSQTLTNFAQNCNALEDITIEGVFGQSGLSFQQSTKLSKASITSIVNALSSTTSGLSVTLSKTAVNNAFSGGSTGAEWTALANTKSNWTINLV